MTLAGPMFEPWERFMLLSLVLEELPPERAHTVIAPFSAAAMVVVRQLMGQKSKVEAYAAVESARAAIVDARKGGGS